MLRKSGLIATFYRPIIVWNLSISFMNLLVLVRSDRFSLQISLQIFTLTFLTVGFVFGLFGNHMLHKQEYPFYLNAGYSMRGMILLALGLNTLIGFTVVSLAVLFGIWS